MVWIMPFKKLRERATVCDLFTISYFPLFQDLECTHNLVHRLARPVSVSTSCDFLQPVSQRPSDPQSKAGLPVG